MLRVVSGCHKDKPLTVLLVLLSNFFLFNLNAVFMATVLNGMEHMLIYKLRRPPYATVRSVSPSGSLNRGGLGLTFRNLASYT